MSKVLATFRSVGDTEEISLVARSNNGCNIFETNNLFPVIDDLRWDICPITIEVNSNSHNIVRNTILSCCRKSNGISFYYYNTRFRQTSIYVKDNIIVAYGSGTIIKDVPMNKLATLTLANHCSTIYFPTAEIFDKVLWPVFLNHGFCGSRIEED